MNQLATGDGLHGTDGAHLVNGVDVSPSDNLPHLPLKAGQVLRETPSSAADLSPKPVYLLRVPGVPEVASFKRDVVMRCGTMPSDAIAKRVLADGARDCLDEDAAAFVERMSEPDTKPAPEDLARLSTIEAAVTRDYPAFRQLLGVRLYIQQMLPFIALQHYLVGWENGPCDFKRRNGLTDPDCISQIPNLQRLQLGTQALLLNGVIEDLAKN